MMPICEGTTPDLKKRVTIFSTFEASVLSTIKDITTVSLAKLLGL
jgi:hypothetical protein